MFLNGTRPTVTVVLARFILSQQNGTQGTLLHSSEDVRNLTVSFILLKKLSGSLAPGLGLGMILWNDLGDEKWIHIILVGSYKRKRPLGRLSNRREDNIRMNLRETGRQGVEWIHLAQDRDQWKAVLNTIMNLRIP
jgi:hypothetical protein